MGISPEEVRQLCEKSGSCLLLEGRFGIPATRDAKAPTCLDSRGKSEQQETYENMRL